MAGDTQALRRLNEFLKGDDIGPVLRAEREQRGISLRSLAKLVGISPSALSQIETGQSRPSVSTLYSVLSELDVSLDDVFGRQDSAASARGSAGSGRAAGNNTPSPPRRARKKPSAEPASARGSEGTSRSPAQPSPQETPTSGLIGPLQRADARKKIELDSGVRWERLTVSSDPEADFLYVTYEVGGASSADRRLTRHYGREYGLLVKGRLRVTIQFEEYDLQPGDSISFDSLTPHLLENVGDEPVEAVWFVVGRGNDRRAADLQSSDEPS